MRSARVFTHIEARVTLRVYIYINEVVYCTAVELCFRASVARKVKTSCVRSLARRSQPRSTRCTPSHECTLVALLESALLAKPFPRV